MKRVWLSLSLGWAIAGPLGCQFSPSPNPSSDRLPGDASEFADTLGGADAPTAADASPQVDAPGADGPAVDGGATDLVDADELDAGSTDVKGLDPADAPDAEGIDAALPIAAVVFTTSDRTVRPTECSLSIAFERRVGMTPTPVDDDTAVQVSSTPAEALRFFSDAACGQPLAQGELVVPSGAAGAEVFVVAQDSATVKVGFGPLQAQQPVTYQTCDTCPSCDVGCCGPVCSAALDCLPPSAGSTCPYVVDCSDNPGTCKLQCEGGADCAMDCDGTNNCEATCSGSETRCRIRCNDATNCDTLDCLDGAECIAFCGPPTDCSFDDCDEGGQSCPGNVIVCNRSCP